MLLHDIVQGFSEHRHCHQLAYQTLQNGEMIPNAVSGTGVYVGGQLVLVGFACDVFKCCSHHKWKFISHALVCE